MKVTKGFLIIIFFLFLGNLITQLVASPIPDTVFGMILLFIALNLKLVKLEDIEEVSNGLVGLLALFLVPSAVSFIDIIGPLKNDLGKIFLLVVLSTLITMVVTGLLVQRLQGGKKDE